MLEWLKLENVGPAPKFELDFAPRVNLITGDNGLGKSFLLDVAWFALTGHWLHEANSRLSSGHQALPSRGAKSAAIEFAMEGFDAHAKKHSKIKKKLRFSFNEQQWTTPPQAGMFRSSGRLILQSSIDGEFGTYDPTRGIFGFSFDEVQNGLIEDGKISCNGLIRDWTIWQLENGDAFKQLKAALNMLSPDSSEILDPGKPIRVSIDDVRDIPTLKMPYGQEVPITHASAGIRRIIALAYLMVWMWQEHLRAVELKNQQPIKEIIILIDELEEHLHPRWQRVILPALLEVAKTIMSSNDVRVQIIAATHSPMVMTSLEPQFDPEQDAWFDLNLVDGEVTLEKMLWRRHGDANAWLKSEAFDMASTYSIEASRAMERASAVARAARVSKKRFLEVDTELRRYLSDTDPFWIRWRFLGEKKGWL